ncbi:vacuolar cation/proton exchanger 2-like isoform X2 [Olea europaea var. sylvestris]|uniref:vacuolar cation/proton exchanger 2-like isoform X2 n=1 Tax=Olea europaea var. sylvestris TaxID=158386 RepID=UPI000C1D2741|nr:vacuolar cation/proton exchanger 2-like isoform X2 [Olea europaea var. sylvestris]
MGSIEEKVDLESAKDQNIPFNSTQPTKKSQSFNFEANRVISPPSEVSFSSLLRKMHRISWLRSIYIVLIKAKINTLLPFGFIAIMLHRLTGKHGPVVFFLCLLGIIPVAERLGYVTEQLAIYTGPTGLGFGEDDWQC